MKVCIKMALQKSNVRNVYVHTNDYEQADHNYLYTKILCGLFPVQLY